MGLVKRIWYLSPMPAAKVQASLHIRTVSPEPPLLAHTSSEPRGTFRQKAWSLAPLNGWACTVKINHDGMLEDTNSLDAPHIVDSHELHFNLFVQFQVYKNLLLDMVARWDAHLPGIQTVAGLILRSGKTFSVDIGHEIISTAIVSLPLIQEGQFSVTGERMCKKYWLTA